MKIQKHFAKKIGKKSYYKYVIVIPPETLKQANFKPGDELSAEISKGEIKLRKK